MDFLKDKLTKKLDTDLPYMEHLLFFVEKGDFKSFASEVRKHDNFLKDLDLSIKNKEKKKSRTYGPLSLLCLQ